MIQYPQNMREKTAAIAEWLGFHHEDIAYGLRSVADAEKLYDYWALLFASIALRRWVTTHWQS